jgi:hypothetical protein
LFLSDGSKKNTTQKLAKSFASKSQCKQIGGGVKNQNRSSRFAIRFIMFLLFGRFSARGVRKRNENENENATKNTTGGTGGRGGGWDMWPCHFFWPLTYLPSYHGAGGNKICFLFFITGHYWVFYCFLLESSNVQVKQNTECQRSAKRRHRHLLLAPGATSPLATPSTHGLCPPLMHVVYNGAAIPVFCKDLAAACDELRASPPPPSTTSSSRPSGPGRRGPAASRSSAAAVRVGLPARAGFLIRICP